MSILVLILITCVVFPSERVVCTYDLRRLVRAGLCLNVSSLVSSIRARVLVLRSNNLSKEVLCTRLGATRGLGLWWIIIASYLVSVGRDSRTVICYGRTRCRFVCLTVRW